MDDDRKYVHIVYSWNVNKDDVEMCIEKKHIDVVLHDQTTSTIGTRSEQRASFGDDPSSVFASAELSEAEGSLETSGEWHVRTK